MPPARELDPTASPRAFFGAELRRLRTIAGLTIPQLAEKINYSVSAVSAIENGKRTPVQEFADLCDDVLNTGGSLTRLLPLVRQSGHESWFRPWVDQEREADTLKTWEPLLVPGLLQTAEYARAVLSRRAGATPEEVEELVAARLERQKILSRDEPPLLWVLMDEGVLYRPIGGPQVMHDQLVALVEASQRPNVTLQVVPLDAEATPGLNGAFVISSAPTTPDTVYLDTAAEGHVTDRPADVEAVSKRYDTIHSEALPARASADLITKVMKERWTQD